uniref:Uncharacterized protein n=2 Tax=Oxyrrhis marina TaxID=2969 RepID=A0A7S3UJS7_OXYMA
MPGKSHPALWDVDNLRNSRVFARTGKGITPAVGDGIVGYRGFINGKDAETCFGATYVDASDLARSLRPRKEVQKDPFAGPGGVLKGQPLDAAPQGKKSLRSIANSTDLMYSPQYGSKTGLDAYQSRSAAASPVPRTFSTVGVVGSGGVIPRRAAESHVMGATPSLINFRGHRMTMTDSEPRTAKALPGYAGFKPGENAETVFGSRFRKTCDTALQMRSASMHASGRGSGYRADTLLRSDVDAIEQACR